MFALLLAMVVATDGVERILPAAVFHAVDLATKATMRVEQAPVASVVVTGEHRFVRCVTTNVRDGRLVIGWAWRSETSSRLPGTTEEIVVTARADCRHEGNPQQVIIRVTAPAIDAVTIRDQGTVQVAPMRAPLFAASIPGRGSITIDDLRAGTTKLSIAGTGRIAATGELGLLGIAVPGSGVIDPRAAHAGALDLAVAGHGDIAVSVDGPASGSIAGRGTITIGGHPACAIRNPGSAIQLPGSSTEGQRGMKRLFAVMALAVCTPVVAAAPKPILMIVGMPHLANPARDIANTKVEDVLTPGRQHEIEALVDRLAAFRPTHVAVERESGNQAKLDQRYADYRAGRLKLSSDETDQIGLRLAAKLGLARVETVDWNQEPPGKDDDYEFPAWLKAHGRTAEWEAFQKAGQSQADAKGAFQRCHPVADWVRSYNDEAGSAEFAQPYFQIATFGDNERNPGAAWVGAWYARNLRIYANLLRVGGGPGDRTIAIFGAGHGPLLRSNAVQSGRFTLVDVLRYLPPASKATC